MQGERRRKPRSGFSNRRVPVRDGRADTEEQRQNQHLLHDLHRQIHPCQLRGDVKTPVARHVAQKMDAKGGVNRRKRGGQQQGTVKPPVEAAE